MSSKTSASLPVGWSYSTVRARQRHGRSGWLASTSGSELWCRRSCTFFEGDDVVMWGQPPQSLDLAEVVDLHGTV